ncbi:hypothetical protein NHG35_06080 [Aerococcaceae bacterium NML180378]|nr:hypothetical protein [Aerococcaceae bacterium NML180378]
MAQTVTVLLMLFLLEDIGTGVHSFGNKLKHLYVISPMKARVYVFLKLIKQDFLKIIPLMLLLFFSTYTGFLTVEIVGTLFSFMLYISLFYWHRSSITIYWMLGGLFVIAINLQLSLLINLFPLMVLLFLVFHMMYMNVDYYQNERRTSNTIFLGDMLTIVGWVVLFLVMRNVSGVHHFPLEQLLVFIVMSYLSIIEVNYTENLMRLNRYKAKFFVSLVKQRFPTLDFLSEHQINRIKSSSLIWVAIIFGLMLYTNRIIEFLVLLLGLLVALLFSSDVIIYKHLLSRSTVYSNKVTLFLIQNVFNILIFNFMMFFSIRKLIGNHQILIMKTLGGIYIPFYTVVYATCILFFIFRQLKLYRRFDTLSQ